MVKKGNSVRAIDLEGWFLDMLYNFELSIEQLKKETSANLGMAVFWLKVVLTHMYLIRRKTEPIDRIGTILVAMQQSK